MYPTVAFAGYVSNYDRRAYWIDQDRQDYQTGQKNDLVVEVIMSSNASATRPPSECVIDDLKQDVERLMRDIAELQKENNETRASVVLLGDLMDGLQDQYNKMLKDHNATTARNVELKRELDTLRAVVNNRSRPSDVQRTGRIGTKRSR
jgi:chromosome segregation ATPase